VSQILVTGGAGFVGSHLVDVLVEKGHSVEVIDNLEPQVHSAKPPYLNENVRYIFKDLREEGVLSTAVARADVIVHLAAMVGVGQSMYQEARYVEANVLGTAKLLQALTDKAHHVRKIVVASSMSIYGEGAYACKTCGPISPTVRPDAQLSRKEWEIRCPTCNSIGVPVPTSETKALNPNSVYAVTKRDQEELCLTVGRAYGIPTVALRFFNIYGPRQSLVNPYTGVCAIFQTRIKNGQAPVIFEDGKQTRDFVSVHDVVRATLLVIERNGADFQAVNIGSGQPVSILDIANVSLRLYSSRLRVSILQRARKGDVRHCYADISKARKLLGYEPKVSLRVGLKELVEWGKTVKSKDGFNHALEELQTKGLA
jgi:dTDP-L-rhamnose 4-epimerase